ncbi:MAG TPA: bifunctional tetrahydrofolate synthase/dihydrofolate synthase, partial [Pseudomonas sp.]|nr:bifunctional tetrahydrofolate synthase/dihydrofolate synthase [Pseudomonas sp.]
LPWDPARLARALLQTRVVGRLDSRQVLWNGRRIALLLDVGHNPHA